MYPGLQRLDSVWSSLKHSCFECPQKRSQEMLDLVIKPTNWYPQTAKLCVLGRNFSTITVRQYVSRSMGHTQCCWNQIPSLFSSALNICNICRCRSRCVWTTDLLSKYADTTKMHSQASVIEQNTCLKVHFALTSFHFHYSHFIYSFVKLVKTKCWT